MAKGFDRSFPDIGARETRVTGEQKLRFRPDGSPYSGLAAPETVELLIDESFWEADPPVTRVGAVVQALQSRIWAAAEVAMSDIERQWYLRRSMDLQRFADWVQVKARDLTPSELRQRVHDVFLAYYEGGAARGLRRVAGAYTGEPAFITRTDEFPGYWRVGHSAVTSINAFAPAQLFPGLLLTSASSETQGGIGTLFLVAAGPGRAPTLAWQAPGDTGPGEPVDVLENGRVELTSLSPELILFVEILNKATIDVLDTQALRVNVIQLISTCEDHENWVPGAENLNSGVWVELLGQQARSDDENAEMLERLRDVADIAPLNLERYDLEEPGGQLVPKTLESLWDRTLNEAVPCFRSQIPDIDESLEPWMGPSGFISGFAPSGITPPPPIPHGNVCVPICNGPFLVIRDRFHDYEEGIPENFGIGPNFHWQIDDEIVSQPESILGVTLTQISFETLSGRGVLSYDPLSDSLLWQAPDPDGPEGLDPSGSGAAIEGTTASALPPVDVTGVTILDVGPGTPAGIGVLRYESFTSQLVWQAPGDEAGDPVTVPSDPEVELTLRSATAAFELRLRVVPSALPAFDTEEDITVITSESVSGISIVGVTAHNRPGDGLLELEPMGDTPTLRWTPPGGARGAAVLIPTDGFYVVPGGDGFAAIYVRVSSGDLPSLLVGSATITVLGQIVGTSREVELASGNGLYTMRMRVVSGQLPADPTWEGIRVRTSEMRTRPIDVSSLNVGADEFRIDFSVLDRLYSESVVRRVYVRLGSSADETDGSFGDFEEVTVQGTFDVPDGKPFIQYRVVIEPSPDYSDFPRRDYYEFVAVAMRPSILRPPADCCEDDDGQRLVTWGLSPECEDLFTDFGLVTMGLDGFGTTVHCTGEDLPLPEPSTSDPVWRGPNARPTVDRVTGDFGDLVVNTLWAIRVVGSDSDGNTPLQYAVDFGDGRGFSPWQASNSFSVLYVRPGTYTVRVKVRDSRMLESNTFELPRVVEDPLPNQPPIIQNVVVTGGLGRGGTVTFTVTAFDPEGTVALSYAVDFDEDLGLSNWTPVDVSSGNFQFSHTWQTAGLHNVAISLRDAGGATSNPRIVPVTVSENRVPRIIGSSFVNDVTPPEINTKTKIFITALDDDGNYPLQASIDWDTGDGFTSWAGFNQGQNSHKFQRTWPTTAFGLRNIVILVRDSTGLEGVPLNLRFNVVARPVITGISDTFTTVQGQLCSVTVDALDYDRQYPLSWTADWDEGAGFEAWSEASGLRFTFGHVWGRAGSHSVRFKVRDASGLESLVTQHDLVVT